LHRPLRKVRAFLALLWLALNAPAAFAAQALLTGHFDLSPEFRTGPGGGWKFSLYDFDTRAPVEPRRFDVGLNSNARLAAPGGGVWSPLGASVGQPIWIMPQIQTAGILFFGVRTDDVQASAFANSSARASSR